jgi:membrane protease YdiL (CAAX protease family)
LLIGVGPAIGEELWFRGFLGQGVAARYGRFARDSHRFGPFRFRASRNPLQAIVAMMLGVILHLTYVATRSILIPMMLHFLNNTLAVLSAKKSLPFLDSLANGLRNASIAGAYIRIARFLRSLDFCCIDLVHES